MRAEGVSRYGFALCHVPLEPFNDRIQVGAQLRSEPQGEDQLSNDRWRLVRGVRGNGDAQRAARLVDWRNAPGHRRLAAAGSAYFEVVTDAVDPVPESSFVRPATQVVDRVPGVRSGPGLDRVARAKRMATLQVAGPRNRFPDFLTESRPW